MSDFTIDMTDTGQREHFILCNFIARMRIETRTNMVHSGGSTIAKAKAYYNTDPAKPVIWGRTKQAVLVHLETMYEERYGRKYGAS